MQLIDTHCHIHEAGGTGDVAARWHKAGLHDPGALLAAAQQAGVGQLICVGCTLTDSRLAAAFAAAHDGVWASIGIHPHETQHYADRPDLLAAFAALLLTDVLGPATLPPTDVRGGRPGAPAARSGASTMGEVWPDRTPHVSEHPPKGATGSPGKRGGKIVAIGECGLDYFYNHSPKAAQEKVLRFQLDLAAAHQLPLIFHIRDAFDDFWPIFDAYPGLRGVVHSFSATEQELAQILSRGLYVGLNGIMTFTKNPAQLAAARAAPTDRLLLETDAPFLTPAPHRGNICEPRHVRVTAEFLANLRGSSPSALASATTQNAHDLFNL